MFCLHLLAVCSCFQKAKGHCKLGCKSTYSVYWFSLKVNVKQNNYNKIVTKLMSRISHHLSSKYIISLPYSKQSAQKQGITELMLVNKFYIVCLKL